MPFFLMYWRRMLRRPGNVLIWALVPFVFMAIYSAAFGGGSSTLPKTGLAILDQDSTTVSKLVPALFERGPLAEWIEVHPVADKAEMEALFEAETASACLVLPDSFAQNVIDGSGATLTLLTNPRHYVNPQIAEALIGGLVAIGNGLLGIFAEPVSIINKNLTEDESPSVADVASLAGSIYAIGGQATGVKAIQGIDVKVVTEDNEDADDFNMAAMFFPGLIMFGLLSVSISLESRFLIDRKNHVTGRFVMAPVKPFSFVLQQRIYVATFLYLMAVVSALIGGIIWKIPPVGLATAHLISIAMILFIVGVNGVVYSLSNSIRTVSAIGSAVMMVLLILGGGFFPAEFTPTGFQAISRIIPTGMANLGLTAALTGRDIPISVPILFADATVFFVLSLIIGRRRFA